MRNNNQQVKYFYNQHVLITSRKKSTKSMGKSSRVQDPGVVTSLRWLSLWAGHLMDLVQIFPLYPDTTPQMEFNNCLHCIDSTFSTYSTKKSNNPDTTPQIEFNNCLRVLYSTLSTLSTDSKNNPVVPRHHPADGVQQLPDSTYSKFSIYSANPSIVPGHHPADRV